MACAALSAAALFNTSCQQQERQPESTMVAVAEHVQREPKTEAYRIKVEGQVVPIYTAGVSKDVQQPPLDLDADYFFGNFDFSGKVEVELQSSEPLSALSIRSVDGTITSSIDGNRARFTLDRPGQYLIERNHQGRKDPLLLFANALEQDKPDPQDPDVIYFGPGHHQAGVIEIADNQTLYLADGAVVTGRVVAKGDNITIRGRGLLENAGEEHNWKYMLFLDHCKHVLIEGITLRKHTRGWTLVDRGGEDIEIRNVKIVGSHSYNDDGIDLCNTQHAKVIDCFVRTNDDSFAFKGMEGENHRNMEHIEVRRCMFWSDLCTAILLGDESHAEYMRHITFADSFVPYLSYEKYPKKFLMLHACEEMRMESIRIENIKVGGEAQSRNYIEIASEFNQWCESERAGYIKDVVIKDIALTGDKGDYFVVVKGFDESHRVSDVRFENCSINGQKILADYPQLEVGDFVDRLNFE